MRRASKDALSNQCRASILNLRCPLCFKGTTRQPKLCFDFEPATPVVLPGNPGCASILNLVILKENQVTPIVLRFSICDARMLTRMLFECSPECSSNARSNAHPLRMLGRMLTRMLFECSVECSPECSSNARVHVTKPRWSLNAL